MEQQKTPEGGLRIVVKGGGCSGLSYAMEWAQRRTEKDRVFERDGARVFIDSKSLLYLAGSELSFEQGLMSTGFKIKNPNVKASCGCGESSASMNPAFSRGVLSLHSVSSFTPTA